MSPNIQESEPAGRKRSHDEFAGDIVKVEAFSDVKAPVVGSVQPGNGCAFSPVARVTLGASPEGSPALTETDSTTPTRKPPSPETPTKSIAGQKPNDPQQAITGPSQKVGDMGNPTAKRKRLTTAEKEAKDKEAADRKRERDEKAAVKAVEKAKAEEEKAARAKEREDKRKKKEEEEREKQREKDEKRRKKEEEQQKKARAQPTLNSFFGNPSTPKKFGSDAAIKDESPRKASPAKPEPESRYQAMFKPFFLKENTRWNKSPIQMDEETKAAKSQILDEFISGKRRQESQNASFDPVEIFTLLDKPKRGRQHHPVKHIMEQVYKDTDGSGSAGADEASQMIKQARKKLATVPIKVIAFSQDVRPPYYGTVTFKPFALGQGNMRKLARRTMGRRLPLDYDYDSEAEWQDEEGEDLDLEDDEEELEDEDDMDGFLDDSEDAGVARRIFGNTVLEPNSTGICFENDHRAGPSQALYENAMEFMHGGLEHSWGVDPFSTKYWEPEVKAKPAKPAKTAPYGDKAAKMAPPPAPSNAFAALGGGAGAGGRPDKMVKDELLYDVKQAILANKALSKVGIVDFVFQQFRSAASRAEVKNTIEYVAEKKGTGRAKEWALKPGHETPA